MKLGRVDICLDVKNVPLSFNFYSELGFKMVEGDISKGWIVIEYFNLRLGLFENTFKGIVINFRGGDVQKISEQLKNRGYVFHKDYKQGKDGGGSATLLDPDGYTIYFDSTKDEMKEIQNYEYHDKDFNDYTPFLGRCDFCIDSKNVQTSYTFYKNLGLKNEEKHIEEGWTILSNQNLRLAIFKRKEKIVTFNFRGGSIEEIYQTLTELGLKFSTKILEKDDGSKGVTIHDPDNYLLYFNSHLSELMVTK